MLGYTTYAIQALSEENERLKQENKFLRESNAIMAKMQGSYEKALFIRNEDITRLVAARDKATQNEFALRKKLMDMEIERDAVIAELVNKQGE